MWTRVGFGLLIVGLLVSSGCGFFRNDTIRGSGVQATEVRELDRFDKLDISGIGKIRIRIGETPSVKVTADDNLLGLLKSDVVGDAQLRLYSTGSYSCNTPITWEITIPRLVAVQASGAAEVSIEEFNDSVLDLNVSGAAQLTAVGRTDELKGDFSGAVRINLDQLVAKQATVKASGAGSVRVKATESFSGDAQGAAQITCLGNPRERQQTASVASRVVYE